MLKFGAPYKHFVPDSNVIKQEGFFKDRFKEPKMYFHVLTITQCSGVVSKASQDSGVFAVNKITSFGICCHGIQQKKLFYLLYNYLFT